jgi:RNA polymerase sigma-70 factor, ECF subfamily
MEIKKTRMHASNKSGQFKTIPSSMGPTHRNHKNPSVRVLRTDDDLVRAAQSGDHEAFTELCRRHAQVARHKILAIVRHREDAEDALQETMLSAYANLGEFRQSSKFSTWITAIGINAALTVIRKRKSRRELDLEPNSPEKAAWDFPDQAPDPESHVAKKQILLLLRTELQTLPPRTREVMTSCYDQDYSQQEAADALGISIAAFKSRLLRGRRSLRSSFEQKGVLSSNP